MSETRSTTDRDEQEHEQRREQEHEREQKRGTRARRTGEWSPGSPSRRDVLQWTAAGVGALTLGTAMTGPAAADPQIPTPPLSVDGNLVVDPEGNAVKLRGFNIADPKRMNREAPAMGKTAAQAIDHLTDQDAGWHPRIVRVPVQPQDVAELMPGHVAGPSDPVAFTQAQLADYLETHLDPVIEQLGERGVYAIVDFHRHWTGDDDDSGWTGNWDDEEYRDALSEEVETFWDTVAPRYADADHVLYEVYNEPTEPGIWGTPDGTEYDHWTEMWLEWKAFAQPWVDTIRDYADNIVIVGSPSWTQSPEGALVEPFDGENLAYAYHVYPGHDVSRNEAWAEDAVNGEGTNGVYEEYPLFVTEFGWDDLTIVDDGYETAQYLAGTTSEFGEPFVDWLESSDGIHWTAWCAHPTWLPAMFSRPFLPDDAEDEPYDHPYDESIPAYCDELPCEWAVLGRDVGDYDAHMGEFIRETLEELRDDGIPSGDVSTEPDEPPAPADVWIDEATETSLEVGWEAVSAADAYRVSLDGTLEEETSATTATVSGLEAGTEYQIGVSSVADGAESDVTTTATSTLSESGSDGPGEIDGTQPADTTGDGLYNDVTASGDTTTNDVVVFFEHVDEPAVADDPQFYDFDGNGRVSTTDVVALFEGI